MEEFIDLDYGVVEFDGVKYWLQEKINDAGGPFGDFRWALATKGSPDGTGVTLLFGADDDRPLGMAKVLVLDWNSRMDLAEEPVPATSPDR